MASAAPFLICLPSPRSTPLIRVCAVKGMNFASSSCIWRSLMPYFSFAKTTILHAAKSSLCQCRWQAAEHEIKLSGQREFPRDSRLFVRHCATMTATEAAQLLEQFRAGKIPREKVLQRPGKQHQVIEFLAQIALGAPDFAVIIAPVFDRHFFPVAAVTWIIASKTAAGAAFRASSLPAGAGVVTMRLAQGCYRSARTTLPQRSHWLAPLRLVGVKMPRPCRTRHHWRRTLLIETDGAAGTMD